MALDPWEVLGVRRDAPLADVDAAYRRVAALFHPDHLHDLRDEARAEGERRFREATEAVETIRARLLRRAPPDRPRSDDVWSHHGLPDQLDTSAETALAYNAQVRALGSDGLHATWPGRHAAGVYAALQQAHRTDGPVLQVEWGAYECTLSGRDLRILLDRVLPATEGDWRREPLENLDLGRPRRSDRRRAGPGAEPADALELGALDRLVQDRARYLVTAEVFVGFG